MRSDPGNGPREDDWLAEDDWLEAPTEETRPDAPRRGRGPRPPGGPPNRRLVALVAGASLILLIVLFFAFRGDGDEPEQTATTVPTETTQEQPTGTGAETGFQISESGTLSQGDSGREVRRLQRALAELGYDVSPDGEFGPGTTAAVQDFQEDAGLPADGIAGPATAQAINAELSGRG